MTEGKGRGCFFYIYEPLISGWIDSSVPSEEKKRPAIRLGEFFAKTSRDDVSTVAWDERIP